IYQGFDPEVVGRTHTIVLGKHSGGSAVRRAYQQLGIVLDERQTGQMLSRVRDHASATKQAPTPSELKRFYLESSPCVTLHG
ncbi:MAG TPA: hypothetical protein PK724_10130, partial [Pseudomonadales bacterium]|nr:hypothetical protein [Pseudomonadales bacterium]